jgi:hypothetical protein
LQNRFASAYCQGFAICIAKQVRYSRIAKALPFVLPDWFTIHALFSSRILPKQFTHNKIKTWWSFIGQLCFSKGIETA